MAQIRDEIPLGRPPARDSSQNSTLPRRPEEPRSFAGDLAEAAWRPLERRDFAQSAFAHAVPPGVPEDSAFAVIPCLNEAAYIEDLIHHLLADMAWPDPLVVVADGGSTDGTREIVARIAARDPRVRLMHNPARLQSAGINRAAAEFGRDRRWMVRIDAHAGYPKNYVSGLIAQGRQRGASSVVVSMRTEGKSGFQKAAAAAQNSVLGAGGAAHRRSGRSGWVDHGHHALFDLESFFSVSGYDETFGHNEDAEFDVRLGRANGRIWLSQEMQVVYYPRSSPSALFRQYVNYGSGRARTLLRHRVRPKLRQMLPVAVAPALLLSPFGLLTPIVALPALLWIAGSLGLGLVLGVKARDPAAAAAGFAAMVMHLGWSIGFWRQLLTSARREIGTRPLAAEGASL